MEDSQHCRRSFLLFPSLDGRRTDLQAQLAALSGTKQPSKTKRSSASSAHRTGAEVSVGFGRIRHLSHTQIESARCRDCVVVSAVQGLRRRRGRKGVVGVGGRVGRRDFAENSERSNQEESKRSGRTREDSAAVSDWLAPMVAVGKRGARMKNEK